MHGKSANISKWKNNFEKTEIFSQWFRFLGQVKNVRRFFPPFFEELGSYALPLFSKNLIKKNGNRFTDELN